MISLILQGSYGYIAQSRQDFEGGLDILAKDYELGFFEARDRAGYRGSVDHTIDITDGRLHAAVPYWEEERSRRSLMTSLRVVMEGRLQVEIWFWGISRDLVVRWDRAWGVYASARMRTGRNRALD